MRHWPLVVVQPSREGNALRLGAARLLLPASLPAPHLAALWCPQDFGARDPTAGELGSNFGDKVLGNYNTEHIIK